MSQQESRISEIGLTEPVDIDAPLGDFETARHWAGARVTDEAGAAVARQLNGPLTALLLYMGEIKQHSRQLSHSAEDRAYLQKIVDNALQQTERVCALVKQIGIADEPALMAGTRREVKELSGRGAEAGRAQRTAGGQRPLTKREREVLQLISEGYSAAHVHQSPHVRKPSRGGHAQARRAQHCGTRPRCTLAADQRAARLKPRLKRDERFRSLIEHDPPGQARGHAFRKTAAHFSGSCLRPARARQRCRPGISQYRSSMIECSCAAFGRDGTAAGLGGLGTMVMVQRGGIVASCSCTDRT
jgi:hypothetical protein